MEEKAKLVGMRIKIIRMAKKLQQQELAAQIGISQAHLSNIESGRSNITMENLFKLHDALGCTFKELFADIE